jgi:hypothetical protein
MGACGAGLALGLAAAAAAGGPPAQLFDTWTGFDTGTVGTARFPWAMAVADLDGDGRPDAVVGNWPQFINPRISVILNQGDGTFGAAALYAAAQPVLDVAAADFDGDGDIDVVASNTGVNYEGTTVSLYRNNGNGTFQAQQQFAAGSGGFVGVVGLAPADFDLDGDVDVAVARFGFLGDGNTVALLNNNGNGTFAAPQVFAAGAGPYKLAAADLDADGHPDLAVANEARRMNVLLNDGRGGFGPPVPYDAPGSGTDFYQSVALGDLDLDGDVDVVYSSTGVSVGGLGAFALFRNQGDGTFAPAQGLAQGAFVSLAVADVTGDGWPDVLGAAGSSDYWSVVPNDGAGGFSTGAALPAGQDPIEVRAADADGDGDLDALVASRDSLELNVFFNDAGGFPIPPAHPVEALTQWLDVGDVDGDGDRDIVASGGSSIQIRLNDGDGSFTSAPAVPAPATPGDVRLRDLDQDGDLDLLWAEAAPPYRFGTAFNTGTGAFVNPMAWPSPTCGSFKAGAEAIDMDDDGDLDVALVENLGCPSVPLSGRRLFISENVDGTSFQLVDILVVGIFPRDLVAGDFDEDGRADLALVGGPTSVLISNGDFTFDQISAADMPGIYIDAGDLDGDGHLDLAVGIQRNVDPWVESMAIMLGAGNGTFGPAEVHVGSHSPDLAQIGEIVIGDVDGDGDGDVLTGNYASKDASVWLNDGDGTFQSQVRYGIGPGVLDLSFADVTGDGVADLIAPIGSIGPVTSSIAVVSGVAPATPGDIDGDGVVGITDLLGLLAAWGPCPAPCPPSCPADLDDDCQAGITDLLLLLAGWG